MATLPERPLRPGTPPPRLVAYALYLWQGKPPGEAALLAGYKRSYASDELTARARQYGLLPDANKLIEATKQAEGAALDVVQEVLAPSAREVAEVLVARALLGQPWAVRLFFERLGGKSSGAAFDGNTPGEVTIRWGPGPGGSA